MCQLLLERCLVFELGGFGGEPQINRFVASCRHRVTNHICYFFADVIQTYTGVILWVNGLRMLLLFEAGVSFPVLQIVLQINQCSYFIL